MGSNPITRSKPSLKEGFLLPRPGGGIGRHVGLKIQWAVMPVRVQVPSRVQTSNRLRLEVFFIHFSFPIFSTGNLHVSEVETPRNDASIGVVLKGNGDGTFTHWPVNETGYFTPGDVKDIAFLKQNNKRLILVANNDAAMQVFEF